MLLCTKPRSDRGRIKRLGEWLFLLLYLLFKHRMLQYVVDDPYHRSVQQTRIRIKKVEQTRYSSFRAIYTKSHRIFLLVKHVYNVSGYWKIDSLAGRKWRCDHDNNRRPAQKETNCTTAFDGLLTKILNALGRNNRHCKRGIGNFVKWTRNISS